MMERLGSLAIMALPIFGKETPRADHLYIGVPRLDGGRSRLTRCLLGSTLPSAETGRTSPSLLWSIVTAPIAGTFFSLATALLYIV